MKMARASSSDFPVPQNLDFIKLEKLFRIYGRYAFGLAFQLVENIQLAEDITHEAFLRYWRNPAPNTFKASAFFAWLLGEVKQIYRERLAEPQVQAKTAINKKSTESLYESPG